VRRRALRSDGLFCFSVEAAPDGEFVLRPTLRCAHSIAYLTRLAGRNKLCDDDDRAARGATRSANEHCGLQDRHALLLVNS
jgi:hypothetical protein